jgi:hypothetical protein
VIRALAAAAALTTLAACGMLGPSQPALEQAVQERYANRTPAKTEPDLRGATIVDFEGCRPLNGYYQCAFIAETGAGRLAVIAWVERNGDTWRTQRVIHNTPPPRDGPRRD